MGRTTFSSGDDPRAHQEGIRVFDQKLWNLKGGVEISSPLGWAR